MVYWQVTVKIMNKIAYNGNIEIFIKKADCNIEEVIDFSTNINFVKPNINIDFNHLEISSYPNYNLLYEGIAKVYGVKKSEIELFNGSSSAIFSLFRELSLKKCLLYAPAYLEYKKAATLFGYDLQLINRFDSIENDQPIEENSLVVFENPSTPDGKYYQLDQLFPKWIKANATIIIDESFLDFTNEKSAIEYLKCYPKIYILKSMTKFYGSAGIRIGVVISNKFAISHLKQKEPLYKISQFDTHYIIESLKDKSFSKIAKALGSKNNILLEKILENSKLFETIYPSHCNFILAKLANLKVTQLQEKLFKYKIMVAECSSFDFLDESYVGFAVKSTKDLELLEEALGSIG